MQLTKLSERTKIDGTCALIFGAAGRGKTFWSASAPGRVVVITDGNGIATLRSPKFKQMHPTADPFIIEVPVDKNPLMPTAFDAVRNLIDELFATNLDGFDTLVIDDIDFIREGAMAKAIVMNSNATRSKTVANNRSEKFGNIMMISFTEGDYQAEMRLVDGFLQQTTDACRAAGKNLIVNAHERYIRKEDDKGNEYIFRVNPLFTGRDTADNTARYFDLVWYLRTIGTGSNVKREFVTDSEGAYDCKTRWGGLFQNPLREASAETVFNRIKTFQETGKII